MRLQELCQFFQASPWVFKKIAENLSWFVLCLQNPLISSHWCATSILCTGKRAYVHGFVKNVNATMLNCSSLSQLGCRQLLDSSATLDIGQIERASPCSDCPESK